MAIVRNRNVKEEAMTGHHVNPFLVYVSLSIQVDRGLGLYD